MAKNKKIAIDADGFTNSQGRLFELLLRIKSKKSFNNKLDNLREEFNIPKGGFSERPVDYESYGYKSFSIPNNWKKPNDTTLFQERINDLLDEFKISFLKTFPQLVYWVVFYDTYILPNHIDTVVLKDMVKERKKSKKYNTQHENYAFPIAVMISPYASKNDIDNFITQKITEIQILQRKYKEKSPSLPTVRVRGSSKVTKRIQSFYGKKKPKEIAKTIKEEFDNSNYDEFYVSKILNKYKKKIE
jgi:hypothetical protein